MGDRLFGGWTVTTVIAMQSGFPIGVTQNVNGTPFLYGGTLRPNIVPGVPLLMAGNITDRITANTSDNLFYNPSAFSAAALNSFGDAPRMLTDVLSPWRNNVDFGVSKQVRTGGTTSVFIRLEVLNAFNIVQWAAPASSAFGNSSFGQITNQANNMRMVQFTFRFQY